MESTLPTFLNVRPTHSRTVTTKIIIMFVSTKLNLLKYVK